MKKTVSTAIGGIVFHIEEDAFQQLSAYLESVQRYFSTFSEGREIIQDIEARIAELLQGRLKGAEREAINAEDVTVVVSTMGTVADFAAADAEETFADSTTTQAQTEEPKAAPATEEADSGYRADIPWQRSRYDRVVAGVFGGIASKIGIDPLWLRVAFAVFFLGLAFFPAFPATLGIAYIILAIVMPSAPIGEQLSHVRKLFREPKGEVIGGVAGGLAAFLGIDVTIIRVIFVALTFAGGAGLFLYVLLWVLTTPASSMTDRMRMKGEPITLSSINDRLSDINQTLGKGPSAETRSRAERLILLPFELLGVILKGVGAILKGLIRVFGAFIGLILIVLALTLGAVAILFATELVSGTPIWQSAYIHLDENDSNVQAWLAAASPLFYWVAVSTVGVMSISFILAGLSLVAAKNLAGRYFNSVIGLLTLLGVLTTLVLGAQVNKAFKESANQTTTSYFTKPSVGTFTVAVPEVAGRDRFRNDGDRIELDLSQAVGDSVALVQTVEGRGATRSEALSSAAEVEYGFRFEDDSLLALSPTFNLVGNAKAHMQKVKLKLQIPEGVPFRLSDDAAYMATDALNDMIEGWHSHSYFADRTLVFKRGKLACLDCPAEADTEEENDENTDELVVQREDTSEDGSTTTSSSSSNITITENGQESDAELVTLDIDKNGIETVVRDKETGKKMRIRITGDSVVKKVEQKMGKKPKSDY